jgi:hypothetical protein
MSTLRKIKKASIGRYVPAGDVRFVSKLDEPVFYIGSFSKVTKTDPLVSVAFMELMTALGPYFEVVENDICDGVIAEVRVEFPRLSITDAMHLATAIEAKCVVVRTSDADLYGLSHKQLNKLGAKYGLPHFSVTKMAFKR